jgi:glutamate synthase (NADPH/NADH) small chain
MVVYRRSREEMPARREEIHHAEEEGIELHLLTSPAQIIGEKGSVVGLECVRYALGEPDASGRRRPVPQDEGQYCLAVDTVIMAIGQGVNPLILRDTQGVELSPQGHLLVDSQGATTKTGVFAGGDVTTGAATVILAMGNGKASARAIDSYLRERKADESGQN